MKKKKRHGKKKGKGKKEQEGDDAEMADVQTTAAADVKEDKKKPSKEGTAKERQAARMVLKAKLGVKVELNMEYPV